MKESHIEDIDSEKASTITMSNISTISLPGGSSNSLGSSLRSAEAIDTIKGVLKIGSYDFYTAM